MLESHFNKIAGLKPVTSFRGSNTGVFLWISPAKSFYKQLFYKTLLVAASKKLNLCFKIFDTNGNKLFNSQWIIQKEKFKFETLSTQFPMSRYKKISFQWRISSVSFQFFIKHFFGCIKCFSIKKHLKKLFWKLRIWITLLKQSLSKNLVFLCSVSNWTSLFFLFFLLKCYKEVSVSFGTWGKKLYGLLRSSRPEVFC